MDPTHETNPDELLDTFEGRGLKPIILFTVAVHAVVLLGTSAPFLLEKITGGNTSEASEEERVQAAVKDATASLRKIADEHGIKPQDLGSQLAGGVPTAPTSEPEETPDATVPSDSTEQPEEPKSAIEEELEKVEEGPEVPPIPEDEEVDLFR